MIHLTFDEDWAPDWAIKETLDLLEQKKFQGTFFVTHASPILKDLKASKHVELGWHPNFLANSSHGSTVLEVLQTMKELVPKAKGVRSHQLVRSTPLGEAYAECGLLYDSSDLLMGLKEIHPIQDACGIVRIGIAWEDDVHLEKGHPFPHPRIFRSFGSTVFNFHPTLLALNACNLQGYRQLKEHLQKTKTPLNRASKKDFDPFVQKQQKGLLDFFHELIGWLKAHPAYAGSTLNILAEKHRKQHLCEIDGPQRSWQKPVRVFLTSVGNEAVHGFEKDLKRQAPNWTLIGADIRPTAAGLYRCDEQVLLPPRSSSNFLEQIKHEVKKARADLILPLSTADQDYFSRPEIQKEFDVPVVVSNHTAIAKANRKTALFESLIHSNPDLLPHHQILKNPKEVLPALREMTQAHGAALLKSDQGTGGAGMFCVGRPSHDPAPTQGRKWWSMEEIEAWLKTRFQEEVPSLPHELDELLSNDPDDWPKLAVAYLPGKEYSVDVLAREGEPLASVVRLRLAATGGLATVSEVVEESDVQEAAETVIKTLKLSYLNNVQFRRNKQGKPQLIEVNPRIPGTISLTVAAGLNLPLAACCLALGDHLPLPQPKIGLRVMRHFGNVFAMKDELFGD